MQRPIPLIEWRVDLGAMSAEIVARMQKAQAFAKSERERLERLKSDLPALFTDVGLERFLVTVKSMDQLQMKIDWRDVIRITKYAPLAYHYFYDSGQRMPESDVREFFGSRDDLVTEFTEFLNKNFNIQTNPGGVFDFGDKSEFACLPPAMFGLICSRFRMGGVVRKILENPDALPENKETVFLHHVDRWLEPKYAPFIQAIVGFVEPRLDPTTTQLIKDAFERAVAVVPT
jgi:hypothetical protein